MKRKLNLRIRLIIVAAVMVALTIIVAFFISKSGFNALKNHAEDALIEESINFASSYAKGKTELIDTNVETLISKVKEAVCYLESCYENPDEYLHKDIPAMISFAGKEIGDEYIFAYAPFEEERLEDPEILEELRTLSPVEDFFESLVSENPEFALLAVYTDTGISTSYDKNVENKVEVKEFNPEELGKDYYLVPKNTGKVYITDVYEDSFGKGQMITIAVPFTVDNAFRGVIEADILIDNLKKSIVDSGETSVEGEEKVILDSKGNIICYSNMDDEKNKIFIENLIKNIDTYKICDEKEGYLQTVVKGRNILVVFDDAGVCDWRLLDVLPYSSITAPSIVFNESIAVYNRYMLIVFAVLFLLLIVGCLFTFSSMLRPLKQLTDEITNIDEEKVEFHSSVKSGDEIELLGNKFETAFTKLKEYMINMAAIESERQRIGTELSVATEIQASYLPSLFPAFPERKEFDLFATMEPAKEVGGDFYDFFMIDDKHLCLVIADVSGKGVGAAMFMMISKTFLNGQAHFGTSPASILEDVNNRLCENNTAEMFVTVWMGVFDFTTGILKASNGGHEYPFIQRAGGNYEIYKDKHGLALGAYPGVKYTEYEIQLNKGDAIFVYTDGVAEATNAENELFGTQRALAALNKDPDAEMKTAVLNVKEGIDDFVQDAPQFDDITMLCLRYFGSEGK